MSPISFASLYLSSHSLVLTHLLLLVVGFLFLILFLCLNILTSLIRFHSAFPMTAREQQLSLWALEAWGHVLPVLLPHAPLGVRDAARAVMSSRDVLAHLEEVSP